MIPATRSRRNDGIDSWFWRGAPHAARTPPVTGAADSQYADTADGGGCGKLSHVPSSAAGDVFASTGSQPVRGAPFSCILLGVMVLLNAALIALTLSAATAPDAVALERDARQIETMLVAPCCWMQPVSQHQSQAAEDVKQQIRILLRAGKGRQEVLDAFVAEYGPRILVEPPVRGVGFLLYAGLGAAFLLTGTTLFVWVRRVSRLPQAASAPAAADASEDASDDAAYSAKLDDELRDMD